MIATDILERDREALIGQKRFDVLRPFDETDTVALNVFVQSELDILMLKPVGVDVVERQRPFEVTLHDIEGWRYDVFLHFESLSNPADQGGFASAEIPFEEDDIARLK